MLRFGFFLLCSALFSLLLRLGFEAGRWITDKKGVFKVIEYLRSVFFFLMVASTRTYIFHNLRRNLQLVYLVNKRRSGVGLHIKYVNSMRVECRHDEAISFLVWISVTAERKSVNVRKVFSVLVKILGILYLQRSRQWLRTASLFWPENGSVSKIIFFERLFPSNGLGRRTSFQSFLFNHPFDRYSIYSRVWHVHWFFYPQICKLIPSFHFLHCCTNLLFMFSVYLFLHNFTINHFFLLFCLLHFFFISRHMFTCCKHSIHCDATRLPKKEQTGDG